ncbi:MAG: RNA polymerase sigma factor [Myxococcales bacterium]|nr:RNA polymerase sigma factor [Myxococcales bacterium]
MAFDGLVHRHKSWLYGYLVHLLGDAGLADDVAQETFLRAWLALQRLHGTDRFRAWLRTIATRTAFNLRRSRSTRSKYEDRAPRPEAPPMPNGLVASDQLLMKVLDDMPYGYREVLVLRYVEDLSMEAIERTLDLRSSALKMRLKRARDQFRERWEQLAHE